MSQEMKNDKISMLEKIKLLHPAGKKAISMDKVKYDIIKTQLLKFLKSTKAATHTEIQTAIEDEFRKNKIKFEGALDWHTEWVKLDLEARKEIIRIGDKSPFKYSLAK
jgi:hypothetical protein